MVYLWRVLADRSQLYYCQDTFVDFHRPDTLVVCHHSDMGRSCELSLSPPKPHRSADKPLADTNTGMQIEGVLLIFILLPGNKAIQRFPCFFCSRSLTLSRTLGVIQ